MEPLEEFVNALKRDVQEPMQRTAHSMREILYAAEVTELTGEMDTAAALVDMRNLVEAELQGLGRVVAHLDSEVGRLRFLNDATEKEKDGLAQAKQEFQNEQVRLRESIAAMNDNARQVFQTFSSDVMRAKINGLKEQYALLKDENATLRGQVASLTDALETSVGQTQQSVRTDLAQTQRSVESGAQALVESMEALTLKVDKMGEAGASRSKRLEDTVFAVDGLKSAVEGTSSSLQRDFNVVAQQVHNLEAKVSRPLTDTLQKLTDSFEKVAESANGVGSRLEGLEVALAASSQAAQRDQGIVARRVAKLEATMNERSDSLAVSVKDLYKETETSFKSLSILEQQRHESLVRTLQEVQLTQDHTWESVKEAEAIRDHILGSVREAELAQDRIVVSMQEAQLARDRMLATMSEAKLAHERVLVTVSETQLAQDEMSLSVHHIEQIQRSIAEQTRELRHETADRTQQLVHSVSDLAQQQIGGVQELVNRFEAIASPERPQKIRLVFREQVPTEAPAEQAADVRTGVTDGSVEEILSWIAMPVDWSAEKIAEFKAQLVARWGTHTRDQMVELIQATAEGSKRSSNSGHRVCFLTKLKGEYGIRFTLPPELPIMDIQSCFAHRGGQNSDSICMMILRPLDLVPDEAPRNFQGYRWKLVERT